ncbi:hypothetical protein [Photobacterium atrarenae]|uniref:Uncharacterized protein n=1 Tax=Photobacterium atrarenae TaxID=865757 RepID=A0ABY5GLH9_9GAMM|nr:hypothetical protein [Photobacterium atrarenae]UTV30169.1 hypothetical protein NNL38_16415 [Photobacterium atrarenae]
MPKNTQVVIQSEDQVYELLEQLNKDVLSGDELSLQFSGWPVFQMRLTGDEYDSTITPSLMKGFLELQTAIYRSYAMARYNSPKANKLSQRERDMLTIRVKVEPGSSIFNIDFEAVLENLGKELVGKMDSKTILLITLGFATLFFADSGYKNYLDHRAQVRTQEVKSEEQKALIEHLKFAQEQETKRAQIMADVVASQPRLQTIAQFSNNAKTELFKRSGDAETVQIQGVELEGEVATELMKNARSKSEEIRLDGLYRILNVDSSNPDAFKVKLRSLDSGDIFIAEVQDTTMDRKFIVALQQGEWGRQAIRLQVNARELNGDIKHAKVIYAEVPTVEDSET